MSHEAVHPPGVDLIRLIDEGAFVAVQAMLDAGLDPNAALDDAGTTVFSRAIQSGSIDLAEMVFERGGDFALVPEGVPIPPELLALQKQRRNVYEVEVQDPGLAADEFVDALRAAITANDRLRVRQLLEFAPDGFNLDAPFMVDREYVRKSPLRYAVDHGMYRVSLLLMEAGANPLHAEEAHEPTPYDRALFHGYDGIAIAIVRRIAAAAAAGAAHAGEGAAMGADGMGIVQPTSAAKLRICIPGRGGATLLTAALGAGRFRVAHELIKMGAPPLPMLTHQFMSYVLLGNVAALSPFLPRIKAMEGSLNEFLEQGWSLLSVATAAGQNGVVRTLLDGGADPTAAAPGGCSLLLLAVAGGHHDVLQTLLPRFELEQVREALRAARVLEMDACVKVILGAFPDLEKK